MNHWAARYIGKEWDPIGDGVDSFNCWTFVQHVQHHHFDRELPDMTADAEKNFEIARACANESSVQERWVQVDRPIEGDVVLLCRVRIPVHVGIWVAANDTQGLLHCAEGLGVLFQQPHQLRISGWGRLTYYRWRNADSA